MNCMNKNLKHFKNRMGWMLMTIVCILLVFSGTPAFAADDPLSLELTGSLVVTTMTDGKTTETLEPMPDQVSPGDLIQYDITGKNTTDRSLNQVATGGGVPGGTLFIEGSQSCSLPAVFKVSIDNGKTYAVPPVKQTATGPDGKTVEKIVPPDAYTHVQFVINALPAQADFKAFYRVMVK